MGKLTAAIYKTNRDRQVLLQAGQQSLEAMTNANEALKNLTGQGSDELLAAIAAMQAAIKAAGEGLK